MFPGFQKEGRKKEIWPCKTATPYVRRKKNATARTECRCNRIDVEAELNTRLGVRAKLPRQSKQKKGANTEYIAANV